MSHMVGVEVFLGDSYRAEGVEDSVMQLFEVFGAEEIARAVFRAAEHHEQLDSFRREISSLYVAFAGNERVAGKLGQEGEK